MRVLPLPSSLAFLALSVAALPAQQFSVSRFAVPISLNGGNAYHLAVGDVNGDGFPDIVFANDHSANQLLLNDGRGRFVDATAGRLTTPTGTGITNATYSVDLVDIDGDGDLDLLLCNDHYLPNRVYLNNGQGVFTDVSATALPANTGYSTDQVVGDFDGDGDVDWYVGDQPTPSLYLNNGAGVFANAPAGALPAGLSPGWTEGVAVDLDGDGDLDIFLPTRDNTPNTVLLNQGNATFVIAPATFWPGAVPVGSGFVADVDGDGRPDLIVNNGTRLLHNQGGGVFVDVTTTNLPAGTPSANLRLACDLDLDGDLDLVGTSGVLINNGVGVFTLVTGNGVTGLSYPMIAADFDGDGDLDLMDTGSHLRVNYLRQLFAPAVPQLGQNYRVELHSSGAPMVAVTGVALAGGNTPVPGLGRWLLQPAGTVVLGAFTVGAATVTLNARIPANFQLLGQQLHYQALVIDPVRPLHLSNAIVDVIQ